MTYVKNWDPVAWNKLIDAAFALDNEDPYFSQTSDVEPQVWNAHPEDHGRAAGGPGSGNFGHSGRPGEVGGSGGGHSPQRERFEKRWPYGKEMDAWAAAHGEESLNNELDAFWSNQDGGSGMASYEFQVAVIQAGMKRARAEHREKKQAAKDANKPAILDQLKKKYDLEIGDVVYDSQHGVRGEVKWGRDGQPYVQSNQGKHLVGSRWKKAGSREAEHSYGSTQVQLPKKIADQLLAFGRSIPDDILVEKGRETDAHVTVKYGLLEADPTEVARAVAKVGPRTLTFGLAKIFASEHYDVIVIAVTSTDLAELHTAIAMKVPCKESDYETYLPHATVAYVKSGMGAEYAGWAGLDGQECTVDSLELCHPDDSKTTISLRAAYSDDQPRDESGKWTSGGGGGVGDTSKIANLPFVPGTALDIKGPKNPNPKAEMPATHQSGHSDAFLDEDLDADLNSLVTPLSFNADEEETLGGAEQNTNEVLHITTPEGDELVFKPEDGEKFKVGGYTDEEGEYDGGWVRDDITNTDATLAEREVLAYRVDQELGLGLVPKTVYGEYEGRTGSAQQFVPNAQAGLEGADTLEAAKMGVFDAIIGNQDRHSHNALIDANGRLIAIDHGFAFGRTSPGGYIRSWALESMGPDDLSKDEQAALAKKLDEFNISKVLKGSHLDERERDAFVRRVESVRTRLRNAEAHLIKDDFDVSL